MSSEPRAILRELLAAHDLVAQDGPKGTVVVLPRRPPRVEDSPPSGGHFEEELIVTPSRLSLLRREPVAPLAFSQEEMRALPHLGDDAFRALTLLPGATANDITAQFHVRGGRRDETQILLDGQELYDAYHLKEFDNAFSIVAAGTLASADLTTGGSTAPYGDRMSGVLDMTTVESTDGFQVHLGAETWSTHAGAGGTFDHERGRWLTELRRGSTDLIGRLLDAEDPRFWDIFGKLDYQLTPRNSLRGNALFAGDRLFFKEVGEEHSNDLATQYNSSYLWLTQQTLVDADLFFESAASIARVDRDRRGAEWDEDGRFRLLDTRDLEVTELRQDWNLERNPQSSLTWGWQVRHFETDYDYFAARDFADPLAQVRHDFGARETAFLDGLDARHDSVYVAPHWRVGDPLTVELGLRYDRYSQTGDGHLSPRLNLAYAVGDRGVLRVAWGRYGQSQRPYELQVEDGETDFYPVEQADTQVIGFEKRLQTGSKVSGLTLRVEAYRREVDNPRPRYENLFEPLNPFPEVEPDRVRLSPERSVAEGFEIFLRGGVGSKLDWWVNYAYASTADFVDGRWAPRLFDETHSVNLDLAYRLSERWRLNGAWRYHTGWPTTPLSVEPADDGGREFAFLPVLGPLNSERLRDYHRFDLRLSRQWRSRLGTIDVFLDVQNVYNRKNLAGFDLDIDDGTGRIVADEVRWPGTLPSIGVSLQF